MRAALMPDAVVIVRPGSSKDRYGNATPDWSAATRTPVYGRLVARSIATQGNGVVRTPVRVAVEGAWSLILPAGTPVDASCRVQLSDGSVFVVQGHPVTRRTIRSPHHITAILKAVD